MESLDQADAFIDELLAWYEQNGRHDLPWRAPSTSPFEVLVAELMLQQTSAKQVLNVYEDFVAKYPTPEMILDASIDELGDDIESLGLRKRARYFRETSEELVENHDSTVPDTKSDLLELQGVGEYTAACTLSHAFGKDAAAVDTNVARILSRVFGIGCEDDPEAEMNWEIAGELCPAGKSSDYIHALIDLGAATCTAASPECEECPVEDVCEYRKENST